MKIVRPRRAARQAVVPQALESERRRRVRPGPGDGQVPPVLEEQALELGVLAAAGVREPPFISRERPSAGASRAQVQRHPLEEFLVVRDVPRPQLRIGEGGRPVGDDRGLRFRIRPLPAGSDPDQERDGVRPGHLDAAVGGHGHPAVEHEAEAYVDINARVAVAVQALGCPAVQGEAMA